MCAHGEITVILFIVRGGCPVVAGASLHNHQRSLVPGGTLNVCHAPSHPLFTVPGILEETLDSELSPEPCTCESEKQEGSGLSPAEV